MADFTANTTEKLTFVSLDEMSQHLAALRNAAQESLIALAALLLADAEAKRLGAQSLHAPELQDQMRRAHDLTWYALMDLKRASSKGEQA